MSDPRLLLQSPINRCVAELEQESTCTATEACIAAMGWCLGQVTGRGLTVSGHVQYAFGHRLGNWILLPPQLLLLVGLGITYT